jgi:hypothetical protein
MLLRLLEILFMCFLYGAGRFICLLAVYAQFVDGWPSIISAALLPAVRNVSGCRGALFFCFRSACLLIKFRLAPCPAGCKC